MWCFDSALSQALETQATLTLGAWLAPSARLRGIKLCNPKARSQPGPIRVMKVLSSQTPIAQECLRADATSVRSPTGPYPSHLSPCRQSLERAQTCLGLFALSVNALCKQLFLLMPGCLKCRKHKQSKLYMRSGSVDGKSLSLEVAASLLCLRVLFFVENGRCSFYAIS